jgi:hypothetical protein
MYEGYLFRANKLYVPESSVRLLLLQESHAGGLMGHFGQEMTLLMIANHFYWPKMRRDVDRFVRCCITCHRSKSKLKPHGLYTPLPAATTPWEDCFCGSRSIFLRWHILLPATRATMRRILLICFSGASCAYMEYQRRLFLIMM